MADVIYSGKGLAAKLPDTSGSMSRLSDFITQAETIKYRAFKENEKEFLNNSNIDPAFFISTANQKAQSELLENFNNKWAGKWKEGGYKMSSEDKMSMQAEKNFVVSRQQEMLAKQKMWEEENALVKKNPADFSEEEHALKTIQYMNTGEFDYNSLPYRPQSVATELMQLRGKIGQTTSATQPLAGNPDFQQTVETTGTREDIAPIIVDRVFRNPRIKKDMLEKWNALPQERKNEYLDIDKSGDVSEAEKQAGASPTQDKENPILKFYIDDNYKYGVLENPSNPQRIKTGTSTPSGFNIKIDVGAGNNKNDTFDVRDNVSAYGTTFGKLMNLGRVSFTSDPQTIDEYVDLEKGTSVPLGAATRIEVVSYSPDKDLIVAKVVDDVRGKLRQGKIIGLKGAKYNDLLKSKPFYIDRESLLKQYGTPTKTTGGELDEL